MKQAKIVKYAGNGKKGSLPQRPGQTATDHMPRNSYTGSKSKGSPSEGRVDTDPKPLQSPLSSETPDAGFHNK